MVERFFYYMPAPCFAVVVVVISIIIGRLIHFVELTSGFCNKDYIMK